jgi:hypothetical protein
MIQYEEKKRVAAESAAASTSTEGTTMKSFLLATEMITAHSTSDSDKY